MKWTNIHTNILRQAFENTLGAPQPGTMAFVRCLTPDTVFELVRNPSFALEGWKIKRVANSNDEETRTITADRAVEIREMKADATLLLVDTELAGAGMDGIYSATREVGEQSLFTEALRLAKNKITHKMSAKERKYAGKCNQKSTSTWSAKRTFRSTTRLSVQYSRKHRTSWSISPSTWSLACKKGTNKSKECR